MGCPDSSKRTAFALRFGQNDHVTTEAPPALFSFRGVRVVLGGAEILRDIDLDVGARGITAVVGASGSGKSTLTRLTNRLLDPSAGSVMFHGTDVRSMDVLSLRRSVGMVFQRPTVFGGTARDNLVETGIIETAQHEAALHSVGLAPAFLDRDAATLSGGEAQRVCLARALLMRPDALVADEATSSLDHDATIALESLVRGLADDGIPILWVTHDLAQMERMADHRVRLEAGRVVPG